MENRLSKQVIGALVVIAVIIGGVWLVKRSKPEEEVMPEIVLESSKMMESEAGLELPMTETEKAEIEEVFATEGVEMTMLKDVTGGQAVGTAWRQFTDGKFLHKVEATSLSALEKGFFYEGWLVGDEGFFSTGRMGEVVGQGVLYFKADEDKSEFRGVVVTLESEDGDPAPAEHILEGSF
jgi:hypothetical protein